MRARLLMLLLGCTLTVFANAQFDLLIDGGVVYDGTGNPAQQLDIAITGDRIAAIGSFAPEQATDVIVAEGLAVTPGFINMLSWATGSLIVDGRSLGDIYQGVTLEVFGEGASMGPLNSEMKAAALARQDDSEHLIEWATLGEYLEYLERKGVAPNVASFVGASTVRTYVLGRVDRAPTPGELEAMCELVDIAMREGALGVGSALIYAPGFYATTDELTALVEVAAKHGGMYISHMRSEGARLLEATDELIAIAEATGARAEIYHLKVSGKENWHKHDALITKIEAARNRGLPITANAYAYTAGATGLDAAMPPWVQEGGYDAWRSRLLDSDIRARVIMEMRTPSDKWENLLLSSGPDGAILTSFRNPDLRQYVGKTLAEVSAERGTSPEETAIDLVVEDMGRVGVIYFLMNEDSVADIIAKPWVAFGSDGRSMSASGDFLKSNTHPRAYGNFARILGKYTRDEGVLTLAQAVHKLTGLPARNLRIRNRGLLKAGYFADIAIFDPETIADTATYAKPHALAVGMHHVLVNGVPVLRNAESTGALPGRVVRGPGWTGHRE